MESFVYFVLVPRNKSEKKETQFNFLYFILIQTKVLCNSQKATNLRKYYFRHVETIYLYTMKMKLNSQEN